MSTIGAKLRELRERRGVNLRELALRSGMSHSTISLIERERISPSVDTLAAILDALGTNLAGFFAELQSTLPYLPFYRRDELVEIRQDDKLSFRMLGANHPGRDLMVLYETYQPGGDSGEGLVHVGQEAGIVMSGAIELTVSGQSRVLEAGDGYYFDSSMPHRFRNVSDKPGEIFSALTPPTY